MQVWEVNLPPPGHFEEQPPRLPVQTGIHADGLAEKTAQELFEAGRENPLVPPGGNGGGCRDVQPLRTRRRRFPLRLCFPCVPAFIIRIVCFIGILVVIRFFSRIIIHVVFVIIFSERPPSRKPTSFFFHPFFFQERRGSCGNS